MSTSPDTAPLTIHSSRLFLASPTQLYALFSDPEKLAQWWGPKGFKNTFHEFDLRPDGNWRFTMHAPDGTEYENYKQFTEVLPAQKVVLQHFSPVHDFTMIIRFEPEGEQTRLDWLMEFVSGQENAHLKDVIEKANEENFDRLEAMLAAGKVG